MPKIASSSPSVKVSPPRRRRCQTVYRIRNGAAYNAGLKQRGTLTVWLTPDALKAWYYQGPTQRGWNVRQHGGRKRRTWRKLHLGVQEATGEIVAQTLTPARVDDASQVGSLLNQVQTPVPTVSADGA